MSNLENNKNNSNEKEEETDNNKSPELIDNNNLSKSNTQNIKEKENNSSYNDKNKTDNVSRKISFYGKESEKDQGLIDKINKLKVLMVKYIDTILNITYVVTFLCAIFLQINPYYEYSVKKRLKKSLGFDVTASKVFFEEFDYIYTFNNELVFNVTLPNFVFAEKFPIVSSIRTTLKRFREVTSNHKYIIGRNSFQERETTIISPLDSFNPNLEDSSDLNNAYIYENSTSFLGKGGYIMELSKEQMSGFNNHGNSDKSIKDFYNDQTQFNSSLLEYISNYNVKFRNSFFNKNINPATLTYDFIMLNYENMNIIPFHCYFQIYSSGSIYFTYDISIIKTSYYNNRTDKFRLFCEILFALTILFYTFFFFKKIIIEGNSISDTQLNEIKKKIMKRYYDKHKDKNPNKKSKVDENKLKEDKKQKKKRKRAGMVKNRNTASNTKTLDILKNFEKEKEKQRQNQELNSERKIWKDLIKQDSIKEQVNSYVEPYWLIYSKLIIFKNTFLIISLTLSYLVVIYWIIIIFKLNSILDLDSEYDLLKTALTTEQANSSHDLASIFNSYRIIVCINFFVLFLRLFNFFYDLVNSSFIIFYTFQKATLDILSFFILFFTFCIGVSMFCFYFYQRVEIFYNYQETLQNVINFSVNNMEDFYKDMYKENKLLTLILLFYIVIFLKFIVLKIMLAILIYWFNFSYNFYEMKNNVFILRGKTLHEIFELPKHILYHFLNLCVATVNKFIDFIICASSGSYLKQDNLTNQNLVRSLINSRRILQGLRKNIDLDEIPSRKTNNKIKLSKEEEIKNNYETITNDPKSKIETENAQSDQADFADGEEKQPINLKNNYGTLKSNNNNETETELLNKEKKLEENNEKEKENEHEKLNEKENKISLEKGLVLNAKDSKKISSNFNTELLSNDEDIMNDEEEDYMNLQIAPHDVVDYNLKIHEEEITGNRCAMYDAVKDIHLIHDYNENNHRTKVYNVIYFILFFICLIISTCYGNYSPHKYTLGNSIMNFFYKNPIEEKLRFYSVIDIDELRNYTFKTLPSMINNIQGYFFILNNNLLLRDNILITVKKNYKTEHDYGEDYMIRSYNETFRLENNRLENTTSFNLNEEQHVPYSIDKSYKKYGGYSYYFNMRDYYNLPEEDYIYVYSNKTDFWYDGPGKSELNDEAIKLLIDEYTTGVFLEFYFYNQEFSMISVVYIEFLITQGSHIESKIELNFLKKKDSGLLFTVGLAFDILTLIFFIVVLYTFIIKQRKRYFSYIQWQKENIETLSIKTQELRNFINPEAFRILFYTLDSDFLVTLLIIVFMILYVIFRVFQYIDKGDLDFIDYGDFQFYNTTIYELQEIFAKQIKRQKTLVVVSTLVLLFSSLRLLFALDFGRYFGQSVGTVQEAMYMIFVFILVLLLAQPSFVCISYIAFGNNLWYFNTWISSLLYTLIQMFGDYNTKEITDTQENLGPLHFYLYIFIVNILLLNVLISILDRSYIKIKIVLLKFAEEYEYIFIFFFCCCRRPKLYDVKNASLDIEFEAYKIEKPEVPGLLSFKDYTTKIKDFGIIESSKLREISDDLEIKLSKWLMVESAFISKQAGFESNALMSTTLFQNIKPSHFHCKTLLMMDYLSRVNKTIEEHIFEIEKNYEHLIVFQKMKIFESKTSLLADRNEEALKDVSKLEDLVKAKLNEVEYFQRLDKKYENLDDEINNEYMNNEDKINENEPINDSLSPDLVEKFKHYGQERDKNNEENEEEENEDKNLDENSLNSNNF